MPLTDTHIRSLKPNLSYERIGSRNESAKNFILNIVIKQMSIEPQ